MHFAARSCNHPAVDPAQPIRITAANGNLTLNGVVEGQADKNVAAFVPTASLDFQSNKRPIGR
jgi:hypothetical protein